MNIDGGVPGGRRMLGGPVMLGSGVTVVCLMPVFLIGVLGTELARELGFGIAGLGLAVGAFRASGVVAAPYLGRVADRLPTLTGVRVASFTSLLGCLGMVVLVESQLSLMLWSGFAGLANPLAQPTANRLLVRSVPVPWMGRAFGVKQSAPPLAAMLASFSAPFLAVPLGWRAAFIATGTCAGVLLVTTYILPASFNTPLATHEAASVAVPLRRIVPLTIGLGLGTAAASSVAAFYVGFAESEGTSQEAAALALGLASFAALATRLLAGVASDRLNSGHLFLCGLMLIAGAFGLLLLAFGGATLMAIGVLLGLSGAWGFNGVFVFAVVRMYPESPGAATGAFMPGALLGSTLGPVIFGLVAEAFGFRVSWFVVAGLAAVGGQLIVWASRHVR